MTHEQAVDRINSFRALEPGWDSYKSLTISTKVIDMAKAILWRLGNGWTPVPCSNGGIQLEFHEDGVDIEIQIHESTDKPEASDKKVQG